MTGNRPTVPVAYTGGQIRAGLASRFPTSIDPREVISPVDIAHFAEATLQPKAEPMAVFPPRGWLPANERIAHGLGVAQHALRDLDDQRAIVRSVNVLGGGAVLIQLLRAPLAETVRDVYQGRRRNEIVCTATFGEGDLQVTLEWPA